jgi:hypothetical protein
MKAARKDSLNRDEKNLRRRTLRPALKEIYANDSRCRWMTTAVIA